MLLNPTREGSESKALDGGVQSAAESAFIKCCAALETVLDDSTRWTLEVQNVVESQIKESLRAQAKYFESQTALTEMQRCPHYVYKPYLMPLIDGRFMAFLGDINDLENAIIGIGESPAEALFSFDEVFNKGVIPDSMVDWLASREAAAQAGKPMPKFPHEIKQEKPNEEKSKGMDGSGSGKTGGTKKRRRITGADSVGDGENAS